LKEKKTLTFTLGSSKTTLTKIAKTLPRIEKVMANNNNVANLKNNNFGRKGGVAHFENLR
jgi:hypothetical protein